VYSLITTPGLDSRQASSRHFLDSIFEVKTKSDCEIWLLRDGVPNVVAVAGAEKAVKKMAATSFLSTVKARLNIIFNGKINYITRKTSVGAFQFNTKAISFDVN